MLSFLLLVLLLFGFPTPKMGGGGVLRTPLPRYWYPFSLGGPFWLVHFPLSCNQHCEPKRAAMLIVGTNAPTLLDGGGAPGVLQTEARWLLCCVALAPVKISRSCDSAPAPQNKQSTLLTMSLWWSMLSVEE